MTRKHWKELKAESIPSEVSNIMKDTHLNSDEQDKNLVKVLTYWGICYRQTNKQTKNKVQTTGHLFLEDHGSKTATRQRKRNPDRNTQKTLSSCWSHISVGWLYLHRVCVYEVGKVPHARKCGPHLPLDTASGQRTSCPAVNGSPSVTCKSPCYFQPERNQ